MSEYSPPPFGTPSDHDTPVPDPVHQLTLAPELPPSTVPDGPSIDPRDLLLNISPYTFPANEPSGSSSLVPSVMQSSQQHRSINSPMIDEGTAPQTPPSPFSPPEAASAGTSKVPVQVLRGLAAAAVAGPSSTGGTMTSFAQDETLEMNCQCTFPKGRPQRLKRHWDHSCPSNLNLKVFVCDYCQASVGRKDNLGRHFKESHPELFNSEPDPTTQD